MAHYDGIAQPKLILGFAWTWLLANEHILEYVKRATKAESISVVNPFEEVE